MVNFRYHIISLVAVFLALGIGVVMGSAVIDRALVDNLEDQQIAIARRVDEVVAENQVLRDDLAELQARAQQLSDEGSQRLLADSLTEVPVLVLAVRGVESEGLDDLVALLGTAGADYAGTLWFTARLGLATDEERRDLARALGQRETMSAVAARELAIARVAAALTTGAPAVSTGTDGAEGVGAGGDGPGSTADTIADLREAGFLDFDPPTSEPDQVAELVVPGTRVVLVSGPTAVVGDRVLSQPLVEALVGAGPAPVRVPVLAVEAFTAGDPDRAEFTEPLRTDATLSSRLSTVNNIDDFAGRLAAVLTLQDLGTGSVGHYGRGAQRLIPAPR
jgi:hypothetical protein